MRRFPWRQNGIAQQGQLLGVGHKSSAEVSTHNTREPSDVGNELRILCDPIEVTLGQILLVLPSALHDLGFLLGPSGSKWRSLQVGKLRGHHLEHRVEQLEFILGQVDLGEDQALGKV